METNNINSNPPKKKNKALPVILALVAVFVLIAGIFIYILLCTTLLLTPKQKVMLAFSKTFGKESFVASLSDNINKVNGDDSINAGFDDYKEVKKSYSALLSGDHYSEIDLTIENVTYPDTDLKYLSGAGIGVETYVSPEESKRYSDYAIRYNGFKLIDFESYTDEDELSIASKTFLDDGYIYFNKNELKDNLKNNEVINKQLDKNSMSNVELGYDIIFNLLSSSNLNVYNLLKDGSNIIKPVKALYNSIDVKCTNNKKDYYVLGKKQACTEYTVTIDCDDLSQFCEDMKPNLEEYLENNLDNISSDSLDKLNEIEIYGNTYDFNDPEEIADAICSYLSDYFDDYAEDIEFTVYLDNKCRLIALYYDGEFTINDKDFTASINLEFTNKNTTTNEKQYLCDHYTFEIELEVNEHFVSLYGENNGQSEKTKRTDTLDISYILDDEEIATMQTNFSFDSKNNALDFYYIFTENKNDIQVKLDYSGDMEPSKKEFTFNMDSVKLEILCNDTYSLELSGEYTISKLDEDIPTPQGQKYDVLNMNELKLAALAYTMYDNFKNSTLYSILSEYF